jgi:rubrerythrin
MSTRRALLRSGLAGGALLLAPPLARAAGTPPDSDLAYLRLLIGVELLTADFYGRALSSGTLDPPATALVKQLRADERAHYMGLATLVAGSGQIPATAGDIDFNYPTGALAAQRSILKLASKLESLAVGAYLGAIENVQTQQLRLPIGQIAANEAQHAGALAHVLGAKPIGRAFAPSLQIDAVSAALDTYEA